ncbi:hypothetical protein [Kineococcus sp. G2]|uniref:hypothetical protein n=1 Tax=Kineococcus sp. G2 TaxID=3127484 RepID=UPI00301CCCCF
MPRATATTTAATLLAGALALAPSAAAAPPRAVTVPCGAVLTTSVRLAADVVCPEGDGVVLAADGIELNLNGHALTGPGTGAGTVGVRVLARDVVVRNGTVAGWSVGVLAGTDPYDDVDDEPEDGEQPVRAVVRQGRLEGNGVGAAARLGGVLVVLDTWFTGNRLAGSASTGGDLFVGGSTADRNESGFRSAEVDGDGLVLRDTTVRRSRGAGVSCDQGGQASLKRTTLQRNGTGVDAFQCSVRIADSAFTWNGRHVTASLVEWDVVAFRCTTFTADGGPLGVPLRPCHRPPGGDTSPGTRVTGTFDAL